MMINDSASNYYDTISCGVKFALIDQHLNQLKQIGYSHKLVSTVESLLCPTEANRPDYDTALKMVTEFSGQPIDNTMLIRDPNSAAVKSLYRN
jgi:hypothetical protein